MYKQCLKQFETVNFLKEHNCFEAKMKEVANNSNLCVTCSGNGSTTNPDYFEVVPNRVRNFRRKKIRRRKIGRTELSPQLGTNRIGVHFRVYSVLGHVTISRII